MINKNNITFASLDKLFASIYPKIEAELMTDLSIRITLRPTVIDAARVLEIGEKDVVDILKMHLKNGCHICIRGTWNAA